MDIALTLLSMIAIIAFEVPRLIRKAYWRELIAFFVVLTIGYTMAFLWIFGVI